MGSIAGILGGAKTPTVTSVPTGTTGVSNFAPASSLPMAPSAPLPAQVQPAATLAAYTSAVPTNPMQQASGAQRAALGGTLGAGTIGGTNLGQYMNPYTRNVIGGLQNEAQRAMQMGSNQLGAAASRAGAFGGSRHGVAEGQMMGDIQRGLNQQTGQLLQSGYNQAQQMAQQDIQNRMNQAAQLGALGGQSFGYGRQIQSDLAQQGQQQQALLQALIDSAKGQFAGYAGAPATSLGYMGSALGTAQAPTSSTQSGSQSSKTGAMDVISTGLQIASLFPGFPSDSRLKKNITFVKKLKNGINVYSWEWNEIGKKLAGATKSVGVLAQEIKDIIPDAVAKGSDGYYRVNYAHPELKGAI